MIRCCSRLSNGRRRYEESSVYRLNSLRRAIEQRCAVPPWNKYVVGLLVATCRYNLNKQWTLCATSVDRMNRSRGSVWTAPCPSFNNIPSTTSTFSARACQTTGTSVPPFAKQSGSWRFVRKWNRAARTTPVHGGIPASSRDSSSHLNPPPGQRSAGALAVERESDMRRPSIHTGSLFKERLPDPFGFCGK